MKNIYDYCTNRDLDDDDDHDDDDSDSYIGGRNFVKHLARMLEVVLEAIPQIYLQGYIICLQGLSLDFNGSKCGGLI